MLVDPIVDIFKYSPFAGSGGMGSISGNSGLKVFPARVLSNSDDRFLGRLKCQIHGLLPFDDIEMLPWIYPIAPIGLGGGPGAANFSVPEEDSIVTVIFPYNSIYFGFYFGRFVSRSNRVVDFLSHYPERYGFKDSVGNSLVIDKHKKTIEGRFPDNSAILYDSEESIFDFSDDYGNSIYFDRKNSKAVFFIAGAEFKIVNGDVSIEINKFSLIVKTIFRAVIKESFNMTLSVFKVMTKIFGLQAEIVHISEDAKFQETNSGTKRGVRRT